MAEIAICFKRDDDEPGYPIAVSGFKSHEVAETERKRLRKVTRWKYELELVEYDPRNIKGGYIVRGRVLPKPTSV